MVCLEPKEQVFNLDGKVIAIDWGSEEDYSVRSTIIKNKDGSLTLHKVELLNKDKTLT